MASLNQIATSIINELNQDNNYELLERIKDRVKFLRATILRRNIDQYGINDEIQIPLRFELKQVKLPVLCKTLYSNNNCYIYETINKIPTPVRATNKPLFTYVGAIDGVVPFYYTKYYNIPLLKTLSIHKKTVFVAFIDSKLRIFNNNHIKYIEVLMPVANMDEFIAMCPDGNDCYSDDDEFLVPYDIIDSIIRTLVSEFINVNNPNSNYTVNIDTVDKQTID